MKLLTVYAFAWRMDSHYFANFIETVIENNALLSMHRRVNATNLIE